MKLLIITYSYAPLLNPRAFRWTALAEYWAARGHEVEVISAAKRDLSQDEVLNGVHVYRVGGGWTDRILARLGRRDYDLAPTDTTPTTPAPQHPLQQLKVVVTSVFKWINRRIWKNIFWPDRVCLWYFPARRKAAQLLKRQPYDAVISVSVYFTAHLVAYHLRDKKQWLVDIGDPFSFAETEYPNNIRLYRRLNLAVERRIFRQASAISVTTSSTAQRYSELFPESQAKLCVIPPLLTLPITELPPLPPSPIRLVFVGSLYRDIRRPDFLLRLFVTLLEYYLDLELHFWGFHAASVESFEPYTHLLGKKVFLHGVVDRTRAQQAMLESHILVNIGNNALYQLPSKVVEYISYGKPILNISQIPDDSSVAFFKTYPLTLNLVDGSNGHPSPEQIAKTIAFIRNTAPVFDISTRAVWLAPFQIDRIAARYLGLLNA
ncbi:MAG: glycosyltransferase [Anaerolineales bacterium]|nr:glycosyltransferase [Anaerolineales bacterium]